MNKEKFERVINDLKEFNVSLRDVDYIKREINIGWFDEVTITQERDWEIKYNVLHDVFTLHTTFSNQEITQYAINLMQNILDIIK